MLYSVDLFSGVGGMQLALTGVCKPLLYCDIDPYCRRVLQNNMRMKRIPTAPVVSDVRHLDEIQKLIRGRRVDVVISTSACKGFSSIGARAGLTHPETALLFQGLRVIGMASPKLIFFENVPGILTSNQGKDVAKLERTLKELGYGIRSDTFTARQIGAPHIRKRWFMVAVRRDCAPGWLDDLEKLFTRSNYKYHSWNPSGEPALHMIPREPHDKKRCSILGNAVVPDCARNALFRLLFDAPLKPRFNLMHSVRRIVMDPSIAETEAKYAVHPRIDSLDPYLVRDHFPTPLSSLLYSCNKLTARCAKDLPTTVRFWKDARGLRGTNDKVALNPQFLEWLMGFPRDYTKIH